MSNASAAPPCSAPVMSVVLLSDGRMDLLDRCLDALSRQTLAATLYEVIIVDDVPCHNTLHLVAGWRARTVERGPRLVYLPNPGPHGDGAARNLGWRHAQTAFIAFTDDDSVPAPTWLARGLAAFAPDVDVLCGRIDMPLPARPTDYQRSARALQTAALCVANCFCRKHVLEQLAGFDERFAQAAHGAADLHLRLLACGARIARCPDALVVQPLRPAPWGISLAQTRAALSEALLLKKHPRLLHEKVGLAARWHDYLALALLLGTLSALLAGSAVSALLAGLAWLGITIRHSLQRLRGSACTASHITEMIVTSALIPPLAVFWRLAGAIRYRGRLS